MTSGPTPVRHFPADEKRIWRHGVAGDGRGAYLLSGFSGESLRPAEIGIADLEKPALAMGFPCQADTRAATNWTDASCCRAEPQNFPSAEINSVISLIDLYGLGEASRATRNIANARHLPYALHQLDAFERF